jgi:DNA polymerase
VLKPLDELRKIVETCKACHLHRDRKNAVFDRGNPNAPLMIVGEAPGEDEDQTGMAFVGKAGKHLSNLLRAARVPDDSVYMANVLKCRPEKNRFPEGGKEPETCRKYLLKQIEQVKPKAIILTGKQALRYLLLWGTHEEWNPLHPWINKQFRRRDLFEDVRFLVCYHPSYLLRTEIEEDEEAWIQSVGQLWSFVENKLAGTPPAPMAFTDIRPPPTVPRPCRNLFGKSRGRIL